MTHGSLFSGIGGFELGARMAGIETVWSCEIERFQRNVLKKNFPNTKQYEDIRKLHNPEYVDIISGGFPCQDISIAGKGCGITGERSGLWCEMFRIIREIRPKYIIIENSPMLLVRGFERVLCDLYKIGYNAEWQCLQAKNFGFCHKRERLFCVAYSNSLRWNEKKNETSIFSKKISETSGWELGRAIGREIRNKNNSEVLRNDDGLPDVVDRIKSCGNAVIPQIAYYIFECIKEFDKQLK